MASDENTLFAFYDLTVSPLSYDFVSFLIIAEEARLKEALEDIHIVVVPFDEGVGHWNNTQFGLDHSMWRLNNVVFPLTRLLPSCKGFTICNSREQAMPFYKRPAGNIFPEGYTIERPIERHHTGWSVLAANSGRNLQHLRATPEARNYARQWIEEHAGGRKVVALTLREARFTNNRDSDPGVWSAFARQLTEKGFFPVILRDIDTALESPPREYQEFTFFPEGVFNLELRLGLYEEAHICAFVANGPAQVCFYNKNIPFLYQVTGDWLNDSPTPFNRIGIDVGDHSPFANRFQRWIWKEQDPDNLMEEFNRLDRDINESLSDHRFEAELITDADNRRSLTRMGELILNWIASIFSGSPTIQELELVEKCLELSRESEEKARLQQLLIREKTFQQVNNHMHENDLVSALKTLESLDKDIELTPVHCLRFGMILDALGQYAKAAELYQRTIDSGDTSPGVLFRLAMAYRNIPDLDRATTVLEAMLHAGMRSTRVVLELIDLYAVTRTPAAAIELCDFWRNQGLSSPEIEVLRQRLATAA